MNVYFKSTRAFSAALSLKAHVFIAQSEFIKSDSLVI